MGGPPPLSGRALSAQGWRIATLGLDRKVRPARVEGMSQREAARHIDLSGDGVRTMLAFSGPPGDRRTAPVKRARLDGLTEIIDGWLEEDRGSRHERRHRASGWSIGFAPSTASLAAIRW